MRKGQRIPVKENAYYPGNTVNWNHERDIPVRVKLNPGTVLYHWSDGKISTFCAKTICTFDTDARGTGHCYAIIIQQSTMATMYGDEARIDIDENSKIIYMGRRYVKKYYDKPKVPLGWQGKYGWTYPSKIIDNRIRIGL
jgi:hypothetical protein